MNWPAFIFLGFFATVIFTICMSFGTGLNLTRFNIPYILGLFFTSNRDKAYILGMILHFVFGWLFALVYILGFYAFGFATWWLGLLFGFVHGIFVLSAGTMLLPSIHPRMASERYGPTIGKQLEPPGFLGMYYGRLTPLIVLIAYMLFGAVLGLYQF